MTPSASRRLGLSVLLSGGGSAHIVASGELDIETVELLAGTVGDTGRRARRIVLDLSSLSYLDAPATARMWLVLQSLRGRVTIVPPAGGAARRFLEVSRLDEHLAAA